MDCACWLRVERAERCEAKDRIGKRMRKKMRKRKRLRRIKQYDVASKRKCRAPFGPRVMARSAIRAALSDAEGWSALYVTMVTLMPLY